MYTYVYTYIYMYILHGVGVGKDYRPTEELNPVESDSQRPTATKKQDTPEAHTQNGHNPPRSESI